MKRFICMMLIGVTCLGSVPNIYANNRVDDEFRKGGERTNQVSRIEEHPRNDINNLLLLDSEFIQYLEDMKKSNPNLSDLELVEKIDNASLKIGTKSITYPPGWTTWKSLTTAEKIFFVKYPGLAFYIQDAVDDANAYTYQYFGHSRIGDLSDAYRHAVWNALMAKYIGGNDSAWGLARAEEFATAHEEIPESELSKPSYDSNGKLDGFTLYNHKHMDLFNNKKGRDAFSANKSLSSSALAKKVYDNRSSFMYLYTY